MLYDVILCRDVFNRYGGDSPPPARARVGTLQEDVVTRAVFVVSVCRAGQYSQNVSFAIQMLCNNFKRTYRNEIVSQFEK